MAVPWHGRVLALLALFVARSAASDNRNFGGAREGDVRSLVDLVGVQHQAFVGSSGDHRWWNLYGVACTSACKAEHRFDLAKIPPFCRTARSSWPKDQLCPSDFAIGVVSSALTIHRLQFMERWITRSVASGAVVRVFFAQAPDYGRIPDTLHSIVIVLDMAETANHLATQLTLAMNARMLADFPGRKWYGKMDDDTFLMLPNAILLMNRYIEARDRIVEQSYADFAPDLSDPLSRSVMLGKKLWGHFVSGGAGYFQSQAALVKATAAIRANLNKCNQGFVIAEDIIIMCHHKALKTHVANMPGMYMNTLHALVQNEFGEHALEGLVKHPITFHWVQSWEDACPVLACLPTPKGPGVPPHASSPR